MPSSSGHPAQVRREELFQRLVQAMQRDVDAQQELIEARAQGKTDAVYWEGVSYDSRLRESREEDRRLRDEVQCAMIHAHLAIGKVRAEIARSRALLGLN